MPHRQQQQLTDDDPTPISSPVAHSDSWHKSKNQIVGWAATVAGLLVVSFVGSGYALVSDMQQRMTRVETKLEDMAKTLEQIQSAESRHDDRDALANGRKP